jgi:hypothetical protein
MTDERERILQILTEEPIRRFDGRYSSGFVNPTVLDKLIAEGLAQCKRHDIGGMEFVHPLQESQP